MPEFAYGLSEFEDAQRLRDRLDELGAGAPVVVVGAGLTGIETAAELAEALTKETCRVLGCGPEAVDIVFEDVKKENWATAGKLWSDR